MSSYHPRAPPPRRSATSVLAQTLRSVSRPRSAPSSYTNLSSYNPYSAYSTPPSSPSYLSAAATPSSSYHSASPSSSYHSSAYKTPSYLNPTSYKSSYSRPSRSPSRFSGLGSRTGSTTSLSALSTKSDHSEGYISEDKSRLGSVSSLASSKPEENGEVDYKKLYEAEYAANERLRETLKKTEEELDQVRTTKGSSSTSETEKRERRAMERKLSEMEEELKLLEALKQENQRLRDENGALIRVISKLSK